jgi:MFS family permease
MFNKLSRISNTTIMMMVTFFANLYFYNHVGTLYLQTRGLSLLQVSSIWSIIMAASLLAEVPTGLIADKIGRKWSVVIALFIQAMGEFLYLFASSYLAFVFIAIIAGIGYAFSSGASEALIYDSLPIKNRDKLMKKSAGSISGLYQVAFFLAPIFGGLIIPRLVLSRFMLAILLTGISVLIAFLLSLKLKEPKNDFIRQEESPITLLKNGVKLLLTHKRLQWIVAISVLTSSFSNSLLSLYQPYFVQNGITSSFWLGISWSLASLAAFILLKYAHVIEDVIGGRWSLLLVSLLPGLGYMFLFASTTPLTIATAFVITYALSDIKNPFISAYQNSIIKSNNRATVLSLISMISKLYIAVMGLIFGRIADNSIKLTFFIIGFLIILFSLILRSDKYAHSSI